MRIGYALIPVLAALVLMATVAAQSLTIPISATVSTQQQTITLGQAAPVTVYISGGNPPYTVSVLQGGVTQVASGTTSGVYSYQYTPTQPGSYDFIFNVVDHSGNEVSTSSEVDVNPGGAGFPNYNEVEALVVTASPTQTSIAAEEPASFTVIEQGGTPPYTISTLVNGASYGTPYNTGDEVAPYTFTYTPSQAGQYTIDFEVQDSAGQTKYATVTLTATPNAYAGGGGTLSVTASPSYGTVGLDGTTPLTITPSGGVPPYTITIYDNGNQVESYTMQEQTTGQQYVYTYSGFSLGTHYISIIVKDSTGATAETYPTISVQGSSSGSSTSTAPGAALSVAVSPQSATSTPGQQVQITATPSGGVPPYQVVVYANNNLEASVEVTSSYTYSFTPATPGTTTLKFAVYSENSGTPATGSATVVVQGSGGSSTGTTSSTPSPSASSSSPITVSATQSITGTVDQQVQIPITVSGGSGSYSVSVYNNGALAATSSSGSYTYTFTPTSSGTEYISIIAKDTSTGAYATSYPIVTVSGGSATSPTAPTSPSSPISVSATQSISGTAGQQVQIPITVSGGSGSYSVSVYNNGVFATSFSSSSYTYTFTPGSSGTYYITVIATDTSTNAYASTYPIVSVSGGSSAPQPSSPISISVQQTITGSVGNAVQIPITVSGGSGSYSITVYDNGVSSGFSSSSPFAYSFNPQSSGTYYITIIAKDTSTGAYATAYPIVTVS